MTTEVTEEVKPFTWMKLKYRSEKTKGKFKSPVTGSGKRSIHKKNPKAPKPDFHMALEIYGPACNKNRWVKVAN